MPNLCLKFRVAEKSVSGMLQRSKILPSRCGNDVSYEEYVKMSKKNRITPRHKEPGK